MNLHNSEHGGFDAGLVILLKLARCYALFKLQEPLSENKEEKKTYAKGEENLGPNRDPSWGSPLEI